MHLKALLLSITGRTAYISMHASLLLIITEHSLMICCVPSSLISPFTWVNLLKHHTSYIRCFSCFYPHFTDKENTFQRIRETSPVSLRWQRTESELQPKFLCHSRLPTGNWLVFAQRICLLQGNHFELKGKWMSFH